MSRLTSREGWREYRHAVTQKKLPGKSEILEHLGWSRSSLMHWAWSCGRDGLDYRRERQDRADRGTLAHHWIEEDLRGRPLTPIDGATSEMQVGATLALKAFRAWQRSKTYLEVLAIELPLVDSAMGYGSTIDAVLRVGDGMSAPRLVVVDWKSGGLHREMAIGMAAQLHLWNLHSAEKAHEALVVRFPVDGTPAQEVWLGPELLAASSVAFCALMTLHSLKSQIKLPTANVVDGE